MGRGLLRYPNILREHNFRQEIAATKTARLWETATNSKRLKDRQGAIADLYRIGYHTNELVSGLGISKVKVSRALKAEGVLPGHFRGHYCLSKKEWVDKKAEYGYRCAYCGKKAKQLTVEHIVALSQGGEDIKSNIIPACSTCNKSKNKRPLIDWPGFRGLQLNQDMI
ncbi:hypothetical protein LCGC14_0431010 [marine sediment metagenome]|uniref:HNH nuclease domain-containing protein n=1 Tax=marine sediment metagenome TaxID=412755 RepID=A0A0F9VA37_9ZZZZ